VTQTQTDAGQRAPVALEVRGLRSVLVRQAVLDGVDLVVDAGQSVAVVGPSGSGKTTLLMAMAGIGEMTSGAVRIAGRDLGGMRARERAATRLRHIGIVYQFAELLPELTPWENVALPALLAGAGRDAAYARAGELLEDLCVSGTTGASTATLSGGERQRVAVARALVNRPALVLADEPTGSLDRDTTDVVADLLFALPCARRCALVVVTHNERVAARADRVLELRSGSLTEVGR
jgi:lipoprotein-releasing system ATP-binding protein